METRLFGLVVAAAAAALAAPVLAAGKEAPLPGDDEARIQPCAKNRSYWQYKGKPVLLLGGSVEDNLFQIPQLAAHLDTLAACGGNYVRCTMSSRDEGNVWPFAAAAGKAGQYDLDRWNPEYWRRFEAFLAETAKRDVIVQIELWATFDYYRDVWDRNPFNPKNNVTYGEKDSRLPTRVPDHPTRRGNDFFRSPPAAKDLKLVRKYQERFVAKLLSYSLKYGHVLYCMDNETSVTPAWGAYWSAFVRAAAAKAGRHVETTEMWDKWDLAHAQHSATFDHPELYSFVDISQNNHQKGQTHYDNALKQRLRIAKRPRPLNNVKIYGADGGRFGDSRDGVERFWRNIFAGLASARFHRPDSGLGLSPRAQQMLRGARAVTAEIDVFSCRPQSDLLGDRQPNEAFCLADPPKEFAVYFPRGGQVTLDTGRARRELAVRWYEIDKGRWRPAQSSAGGGKLSLKAPDKGQWAVVVK